jgi:carbamoyltransferase
VTEEVLLDLARRLHRWTGLPDLVLSGGVALNSVANGRLLRETPFRRLYVQPAASDAGAALGAALRVWHEVLGHSGEGRHVPGHSYLGPACSSSEAEQALLRRGLPFRRTEDAPAEAAARLAEGEILAWFAGAMEYGPRSLGNRSILADPRPPGMKDRLNARVKHREGFRPFAPAVPLANAAEWFETGGAESPYMLLVVPVRPEKRALLPAITHVDGSARLQTVRPEQNPRFHELLVRFGERTGVPVLLNTSFNVRGEPIVATPDDAISCFLGTELDTLFLEDFVLTKPPSRP